MFFWAMTSPPPPPPPVSPCHPSNWKLTPPPLPTASLGRWPSKHRRNNRESSRFRERLARPAWGLGGRLRDGELNLRPDVSSTVRPPSGS